MDITELLRVSQANANMMDEISHVGNGIYITNYDGSTYASRLEQLGIGLVVNVCEDPKRETIAKFYTLCNIREVHYPIADSQTQPLLETCKKVYGNMRKHIHRSDESKTPQRGVLVHCHAGISRSVSMVIYYLMRSEPDVYQTPRHALEHIQKTRCFARPNNGFMRQLEDFAISLTCHRFYITLKKARQAKEDERLLVPLVPLPPLQLQSPRETNNTMATVSLVVLFVVKLQSRSLLSNLQRLEKLQLLYVPCSPIHT